MSERSERMEITSTDLLDAAQLLDDCLIRIYPEEFTQEHINAAAERFGAANGTISRIADMADKLRRASNAAPHLRGGAPAEPRKSGGVCSP